jgi:ATP-binding cassette subfamily C protein
MSCVINILYLTGSFFMLEIYDRVLPSRSIPTLVGLIVLAGGLYMVQGILDLIRGRILIRIGSTLDEMLSRRVYDVVVRMPLFAGNRSEDSTAARSGQCPLVSLGMGPGALFDLPWLPLYLAICFAFHPLIGVTALVGAALLIALTVLTEYLTHEPMKRSTALAMRRQDLALAGRRNAEVLAAMGMAGRVGKRWEESNRDYLATNQRASDVAGGLGAIAKVMRMMLQSAVLGVGAYLVINQQATAGIIIAGSILSARALAPVDLAIAHWKGFVAARQSWHRLNRLLGMLPEQAAPTLLEPPAGGFRSRRSASARPANRRWWHRISLSPLRQDRPSASSVPAAQASRRWCALWWASGSRCAARFGSTVLHSTSGRRKFSAAISATCRRMSNSLPEPLRRTFRASRMTLRPRASLPPRVTPASTT